MKWAKILGEEMSVFSGMTYLIVVILFGCTITV